MKKVFPERTGSSLLLVIMLLLVALLPLRAQQYHQSIIDYRKQYKQELLAEPRKPVDSVDLKYLNFFEPNPAYVVHSRFTPIPDTLGFDMQTHTGKVKPYRVYGRIEFTLGNELCTLYVYQSVDLMKKKGMENHLFIPFTDGTSGESTFGGGRYLDFTTADLFSNTLLVDFNKAYNPYCAYKIGFSCPIPPAENRLTVKIEAGEKRYGKEPQEH